ncbi:hypothetical protein KA005_20615 [bacterium]|nr:hypothetical protein [bacterium]
MNSYSVGRNLRYMLTSLYRPKATIEGFLSETSLRYSILPLILFTLLFEITYVLDYLNKAPALFHFLGRLFDIPDAQYNLIQVFLFPVIHVLDFAVYGAVINLLSKALRVQTVVPLKAVIFFMFIWNTIGLVGFITETLAIQGIVPLLIWLQPLYLVVYALYPMEYLHKQASIQRWKSIVVHGISLFTFLSFRMLFL